MATLGVTTVFGCGRSDVEGVRGLTVAFAGAENVSFCTTELARVKFETEPLCESFVYSSTSR